MPRAGECVAYRSKPQNFRDVFIRTGWRGSEEEFGAHGSMVARWVDEEGRKELLAARMAYRIRNRSRASRYVAGHTLGKEPNVISVEKHGHPAE